jgi:hypothetical protein
MRAAHIRSTALASAVGVLAALTLSMSAPAAQAAESRAAGVDCWGGVHNNDTHLGIAGCTNNTGGWIKFRADVTCDWAPDVSGAEVLVAPNGGYNQSKATCAVYSSGVGHVGWTILE